MVVCGHTINTLQPKMTIFNDVTSISMHFIYTQSNFNGSNIFRTTKISTRRVVRANKGYYSTRSGVIIGIIFLIFFHMKVCCVFSLELPR